MHKQTILHIDSNQRRQGYFVRHLKSFEFEVHKAGTFGSAKELAKKYRYSSIIMRYEDMGREIFNFCSFIRQGNPGAVIIALMEHVNTKIEERLFDCGINDVVAGKQTSARLLAKRLQTHLRNSNSLGYQSNTIRLKDTIVNFDRNEVWSQGSIHQLRGVLADLLRYFLDNPNRVISREELRQSHIWADSICSAAKDGGKTFDVTVGKLRKIIEPDPAHPRIITSVRGIGWKLAIDAVE